MPVHTDLIKVHLSWVLHLKDDGLMCTAHDKRKKSASYLLSQSPRCENFGNEIHILIASIYPGVVKFDDVLVLQCLQKVQFWKQSLHIPTFVHHILKFYLIPGNFYSIQIIKCLVSVYFFLLTGKLTWNILIYFHKMYAI